MPVVPVLFTLIFLVAVFDGCCCWDAYCIYHRCFIIVSWRAHVCFFNFLVIYLITLPLLVCILARLSLVTPNIFPSLCYPLLGFSIITVSLIPRVNPFISCCLVLGLGSNISFISLTFFLMLVICSSSSICLMDNLSNYFVNSFSFACSSLSIIQFLK